MEPNFMDPAVMYTVKRASGYYTALCDRRAEMLDRHPIRGNPRHPIVYSPRPTLTASVAHSQPLIQ